MTASLGIWRVSLGGNVLIHSATKSATELEGERARTVPSITTAKGDRNNNTLTVTVKNDGATAAPLSDFDKMDIIVIYDSAAQSPVRLAYTASNPPSDGEWTKTAISGAFEPDVWNPAENLTILATLVGATCAPGTVTVGFPNGIIDTNPFICSGLDLTFHSETTDINGTTYYQLKNETPADGAASTVSVSFAEETTGRLSPASNTGKFVFPLTGITAIPAANWNLTYRVKRDKPDLGFVFLDGVPSGVPDISPAVGLPWKEIDLSSYVPVGTTGALVEVVETGDNNGKSGVVRGRDDDRDYMSNLAFEEILKKQHRYQIVQVGSDRKIEGYIEHTDVAFKLLAYTIGSDPSYIFSSGVAPEVFPAVTKEWTTVDVFDFVDADADGVILLFDSEDGGDKKFAARQVGSNFDITDRKMEKRSNSMYMVGLNPSKHFEAYIETTNIKIYLIGQTKGSVKYYSLDIPVADPATGSWQTIDADTYNIPAAATGLILLTENSDKDNKLRLSLRHGDNTTDNYNGVIAGKNLFQSAVGLNSLNIWYEFMEDDKFDVYISAYTRLIKLDVHADIDVVIRQADDTIRLVSGNPYLLDHVASTNPLSNDTWQTFTVTFAMPAYTVVAETDYLEIDIFAHAVTNVSGEVVSVEFRLDDPTLAIADQMGAREVIP